MPSVLILGAGSDMAIAIAEKFASRQYDVFLAARNVERLAAVQTDLAIRFASRVGLYEFDALDFDSHDAFFDQIDPLPNVTVCVFGYMGKNEEAIINWPEAARILHTNYTGAVSILNIVAARYQAAGAGTIAGISSVAGERGRQSNYLYGSAKAGFTAYLSGLRNRLYRHGVHVLTVKPGFVYTKMTEELQLPPLLTATPRQVAESVFSATEKKKNIIYAKWFWRWIMLIIRSVPEPIFKKMKL